MDNNNNNDQRPLRMCCICNQQWRTVLEVNITNLAEGDDEHGVGKVVAICVWCVNDITLARSIREYK